MTDDQAAFVEELRMERKETWRSIAEQFSYAYPEALFGDELGRGDQFAGMILCQAASERLGRHID